MPAPEDETLGTTSTDLQLFVNYQALHGLGCELSVLDTRKRERLLQTLGRIRLPDYFSPDDSIIRVEPNPNYSPEVGLVVQGYSSVVRRWTQLQTHSEDYASSVGFGNGHEYFVAHRLEHNIERKMFAYRYDRLIRVHLGVAATFRLEQL